MKKNCAILLLLLLTLSLIACDPAHYQFDYEELKHSVVKVELINYNNPEAEELFEKRDKVISFDFDKMEIMETLAQEKLDEFLLDLSEYVFMMVWRHLDSPQGVSIRILYDNGDFEILSCNVKYSGSFDAEGKVKRFIGTGVDSELINKYFNMQID